MIAMSWSQDGDPSITIYKSPCNTRITHFGVPCFGSYISFSLKPTFMKLEHNIDTIFVHNVLKIHKYIPRKTGEIAPEARNFRSWLYE